MSQMNNEGGSHVSIAQLPSGPMSHDLYTESAAIFKLQISRLEQELAREKALRREALDDSEIELSKAVRVHASFPVQAND
jgi:hypothetical protein